MTAKAKSGGLSASKLRIILSLTLLLIIGGGAGGFAYARTILTAYSVDVSHKKVDADASSGNISSLEAVKKELANDQDVITKAKELKSDSEFPEFDIVEDVTKYAEKNGLTIDSFDFGNSSTTGSSGTATTPTKTPSTTTPTTKGSTSAAQKNVYISVTLKAPVNYAHLLQFMHDTEQSLPKMQIQGISLATDPATGGTVNVQPIVIEMYTR